MFIFLSMQTYSFGVLAKIIAAALYKQTVTLKVLLDGLRIVLVASDLIIG